MGCGKKLCGKRHSGRNARSEQLERRTLLTVTSAEYDSIRALYPEFNLPADIAQINIIEIASSDLSVANLKSAITTAGTTSLPDLVVTRTTDTQNRITYAAAEDQLTIDVPASQGAISIIGLGTQPLTLDAAGISRVVSVGSGESTTAANLGGMEITGGWTDQNGGGVYQGAGTLFLNSVTVSANSAQYGGALYQYAGTMALHHVTISGNTASDDGGGMYQQGGVSLWNGVALSGGMAINGGGLYQSAGTLALTNVTIAENWADLLGGGMYQLDGSAVLTNVTVSRNTATTQAGGIYQNAGSLVLNNTISAGNVAASCPDVSRYYSTTTGDPAGYLGGSNNLIGIGSGQYVLLNGQDGNRIGTAYSPIDPMLAEGTTLGIGLAPLTGSPAIDAGNDALVPPGVTTDIYNQPRIQDAGVNIGAVETVLAPKAAVTYTVTSLDDTIAAADGVLTFREAFEAANRNLPVGDAPAGSYSAQDRILFAPGVVGTIHGNGKVWLISGSLAIQGNGAASTVFDGDALSSVFQTELYTVSLSNLTIRNGDSHGMPPWGGGIVAFGTSLALDGVTLSGNSADYGGGLFQYFGAATLIDVIIRGNSATQAGGGFLAMGSTSDLSGVTITGNTAGEGGGLYQWNGSLSVVDSTIGGNSASGAGGGLYQYGGTSTLANMIISDNSAGSDGGGVYQYFGTSSLTEVTISGNSATHDGGGIYLYGNLLISRLTGVAIVGNSAGGNGGGVCQWNGTVYLTNAAILGNSAGRYGGGTCSLDGILSLTNATVAGNSAPSYGGGACVWPNAYLFADNTIIAKNAAAYEPDLSADLGDVGGNHSFIGSGTGQGDLVNGVNGNLVGGWDGPIDPQFVDTSSPDKTQWDLHLRATSPAINAGSNDWILGVTTDLDGRPRIIGGTVDMGAYERGLDLIISGTSGNDAISAQITDQTLRITVNGTATDYTASLVESLTLHGLAGNDTISVGPDVIGCTIDGGLGDDSLTGGDGSDFIRGDNGADTISGGAGDDTLMGNFGEDYLSGGDGADQLQGGLDADVLSGGNGNDRLYGGNGTDFIQGDAGDDYIEGKGKTDAISGGAGNDTIYGGAGSDLIFGDEGDDQIDVGRSSAFADSVYGGAGTDAVLADANDLLSPDTESVLLA